jgi:hypothetical protein
VEGGEKKGKEEERNERGEKTDGEIESYCCK